MIKKVEAAHRQDSGGLKQTGMIKKVEAALRQNNSEDTELIPVKIRKAGQAWARDITIDHLRNYQQTNLVPRLFLATILARRGWANSGRGHS